MDVKWYLLFDGESEDGAGPGRYQGRTLDPKVAEKHYRACEQNPYSTGGVRIVTDTQMTVADWTTVWE